MQEMIIDLIAKEKTYTSKEVADSLGIGISTLRRWCLLLEQSGYAFQRDTQNRREFRQTDVASLHHIKQLCREKAVSLEQAAAVVASERSHPYSTQTELVSLTPLQQPSQQRSQQPSQQRFTQLVEKVDRLAEHVQNQETFHQALLERLNAQEQYIEKSLKERDRRLTRVMSDILEAKMYVAAAKERERKKSIWHFLFKIRL